MASKSVRKFRDFVLAVLIVAGILYYFRAPILARMGFGGGMDENVSKAVAALSKASEAGDYDQLFGLMSAEYQKAKRTQLDRMKSILLTGTEPEKVEVRAQLEKMGISEATLQTTGEPELLVSMLRRDMAERPEQFPGAVSEVVRINIDREKATVVVKTKTKQDATIQYVKEAGVWKFKPAE